MMVAYSDTIHTHPGDETFVLHDAHKDNVIILSVNDARTLKEDIENWLNGKRKSMLPLWIALSFGVGILVTICAIKIIGLF